MNHIIRKIAAVTLPVAALIALVACSEQPARHLSLAAGAEPSRTEEAERLSKLQMIRVYDQQPTDGSAPKWKEMTPSELVGFISLSCNQNSPFFGPSCNGPCAGTLCAAEGALCVAHTLAEAASLRPTPLTIAGIKPAVAQTNFKIDIHQQSSAGAAALLRTALSQLRLVGQNAEYALNPPFSYCIADQNSLTTRSTRWSGTISEAFYLYRELTERASDAIVSFADFQGSHPSVVLAQSRRYYGPELSRAEAAHLWVGGDAGLPSTFKFCTSPELSGGARTAMGALRNAGVSPVDLLNTSGVSTTTLLETGTTNGASVKARLAKFWDNSNINAVGALPLADQLSISTDDFDAARTYLVQEFKAFARSQTVPFKADSGTGINNLTRWAGTSSDPTPLADAYYAAIAGTQAAAESTKWNQMRMSEATSYAEFIDGAGDFISRLQAQTFTNTTTKNEVLDPLSYVMTDVARERPARWTMFLGTGGSVYLEGFAPTDGYWVLIGDDAARCAKSGNVEGGDCTLVQQTTTPYPTTWAPGALWAVPMTATWGAEKSFSTSTGHSGFPAFQTVPAGVRFYLAQSSTGNAGTFKIVSGMTAGANVTLTNSIVPHAEERAAKILAPSSKWCTQANVTCAGTDFDERLPLENELSQDNDGIESSWKQYLTLARNAANEADARADAYIQAGIDQDLRGESNELREKANDIQMIDALNELQSICGTDIDPAALLDVFKDMSVMHAPGSGTACTVDSGCSAGMKCFGAQCTPDPLAMAASRLPIDQYNRLSRCLNSSSTLPFVTVGDMPVCIWQNKTDGNDICSGYTASFTANDHPCPDYAYKDASNAWSCSRMTVPNSNYTVAPVIDKQLGYFHPSETMPAKPGSKATCDDIRRIRKQIDAGTITAASALPYFQGIKATEMFHPAVLAETARRIAWVPHLSGYSAITVDGEERWRTGDAWRGVETFTWPCNASAKPTMCTATSTEPGGTGLFCSTINCASSNANARSDITKMNERMYRAVEAARLIALDGNGLGIARPEWAVVDGGNGSLASVVSATRLRAGYTVPVTVLTFSESWAADIVGYRVSSATRADTLAWWASNFSWQRFPRSPNNYDIHVGITDATGLKDWSTNDEEKGVFPKSVWAERTGLTLPPGMETKYTAWWDGLSSAQDVGNAVYARYFADVLSGSRAATDVRVDRMNPHNFEDPSNGGNILIGDRQSEGSTLLRPMDYEPEALLDGLELLCDVEGGSTQSCDATKAPTIRNADDLGAAKTYLGCVAGTISQQGGRTVLAGLPSAAFDALRKESGVGAFPANAGELGTKISGLRGALVGVSSVEPKLAGEVRGLGLDLDSLRISLVRAGIKDQMSDIQFMSSASSQIANCASSIGSLSGMIAGCTSALAQINFASQLNELAKKDSAFEREATINNFAQVFSTRAQNMDRYSKELSEHLEAIDANLSDFDETRDKARRALAKAIFMNSASASNTMNINDAYRARYNTASLRYQAAFKNARLMAFVAKRAIEQRLGLRLASMTEALPLVDAPSTWEQSICTAQPVDYSDVRGGDTGATAGQTTSETNYADTYVGDYVSRLENLVQSYRLAYDFHEGTDTAVISLRDDIQHVRAACDTPVDNLLTYSGQLNRRSSPEAVGWDHLGCTTTTTAGVTTELPACVDVYPTGQTIASTAGREAGVPMVYQMIFGNGTSTCTTPTCGWVAAASLSQKVRLLAGSYVLSWYAEPAVAEASGAPGFVSVRNAAGTALTNATPQNEGAVAAGQLKRYFTIFSVPTDQDATLQIRAPGAGRQIKIGAFQLERAPVRSPTAARNYVETLGTRTRVLKTCEDTNGVEFRARYWQRACVNLCPDGFNSQCDAAQGTPYCYRETTFSINQRDIDGGKLLVSSGFARGNFNYRIDNIALNFVGSNTRDCAKSEAPSTCYNAGFIPYSLYHSGPYYVRNHTGDDVKISLFNGRIEHARGLALERYVTNPVSSTDRDLLSTYIRQEFQGRPLDGSFTVRVWDEPGVNFDAIQDVQVVLNYRYWTRFD